MTPAVRKQGLWGSVSAIGSEGICPAWFASILFSSALRWLRRDCSVLKHLRNGVEGDARGSGGFLWRIGGIGAVFAAIDDTASIRRPALADRGAGCGFADQAAGAGRGVDRGSVVRSVVPAATPDAGGVRDDGVVLLLVAAGHSAGAAARVERGRIRLQRRVVVGGGCGAGEGAKPPVAGVCGAGRAGGADPNRRAGELFLCGAAAFVCGARVGSVRGERYRTASRGRVAVGRLRAAAGFLCGGGGKRLPLGDCFERRLRGASQRAGGASAGRRVRRGCAAQLRVVLLVPAARVGGEDLRGTSECGAGVSGDEPVQHSRRARSVVAVVGPELRRSGRVAIRLGGKCGIPDGYTPSSIGR